MTFDLKEPRFVRESAVEARIARIVEPVANDLGYALVRIRLTQENGLTLQIMAEDGAGRFTINDCENLSTNLSPVLDVEDPIDREYHLEVSSPGIDRPLVRARDFARYVGHEARVELSDLLDGRKRFRGPIVAAGDETFTIRLPETPRGEDPDHVLPYRLLADAKLIMTDALIDMARADQDENPIDDDPEIETVEISDDLPDDPEAGTAEDTAGQNPSDDPEVGTTEDTAGHDDNASDDPEAGMAEDAAGHNDDHIADDADGSSAPAEETR